MNVTAGVGLRDLWAGIFCAHFLLAPKSWPLDLITVVSWPFTVRKKIPSSFLIIIWKIVDCSSCLLTIVRIICRPTTSVFSCNLYSMVVSLHTIKPSKEFSNASPVHQELASSHCWNCIFLVGKCLECGLHWVRKFFVWRWIAISLPTNVMDTSEGCLLCAFPSHSRLRVYYVAILGSVVLARWWCCFYSPMLPGFVTTHFHIWIFTKCPITRFDSLFAVVSGWCTWKLGIDNIACPFFLFLLSIWYNWCSCSMLEYMVEKRYAYVSPLPLVVNCRTWLKNLVRITSANHDNGFFMPSDSCQKYFHPCVDTVDRNDYLDDIWKLLRPIMIGT